ncbi:hypothetical protein Vadar_024547 [Vaccinium darrowii]|uniref:Uncharacterized protein n=1 Tax=Vaccinium darrowii TaxID=229202 RepID=A0ACB7XJR6_9ERIC|nr:hypothetical protein Vadar_024547 [Vaccinium darrowii]
MACQESLRFQNEYEQKEGFKYQTGGRYHVGGSSGAGGGRVELGPPRGFERCSSSLRETGTSRTVRTTNKWANLSSPTARLAEMEVDLERSKGNKQAKLLSKLLKTAKKKLGRAVSQFVIYTRLPINTVNSPWLEPMLDVALEVGKGTKLPSSYEVSEVYMPLKIEGIQKWIESYFLNPIFQYGGHLSTHSEVMDRGRNVIMKLLPDVVEQVAAINQNPVDLSRNSSSGARGLSPSGSGSDIGGSGGQNEIRKHADGNRTSHTTYHDEDDDIRGSTQRHSVSGDDVGSLRTNRRSRPLGDFYSDHNLRDRFGQLGVGKDQCQPHNWHRQPPPYPKYPPPKQQPF